MFKLTTFFKFISLSWLQYSLILTISLLFYKYLTKDFNYWKKRNVPYLKPSFLFGNLSEVVLLKSTIGIHLKNLYKKFDSPYFGIWVFHTPLLVIKDPELIKSVLVKDFKYFSDRFLVSDENADSLAANLLPICKNPVWRNLRNELSPVFTPGKLKSMFDLINMSGRDFINYVNTNCLNKDLKNARDIAYRFTLEALTGTVFGTKANGFDHKESIFLHYAKKITDFNIVGAFNAICYFSSPYLVSMFKMKLFNVSAYNFMRDFVWRSIEERKSNEIKRNDLIDVLMNIMKKNSLHNDFNFEGDMVVAQAFTFFTAGLETVSSTISFALYELSLNSNIQDKLRKEIKTFIKSFEDINYDNILKIKYLDNVILETLRKYPALPFLDRICIEDYKMPGSDLIIEKGTPIYIPVMALHYDENYFPNPEKFEPDRFDEENVSETESFAFLPFGEGPRNCIGKRYGLMITKLGLIHLLLNFEIHKAHNTPKSIEFEAKNFLLESVDGIPIRFAKIE